MASGSRVTLARGVALALMAALALCTFDLAMSYRRAGALARAVVSQTVAIAQDAAVMTEASAATPPDASLRLYVAGVPDRLDGVGVLFTGLSSAVRRHVPVEVIVPARIELRDALEPTVSWRIEGDGPVRRLVGETAGGVPALLEGGAAWDEARPGQALSRVKRAKLEIPWRLDGIWLVVAGDRVRRIDGE